MLCSVLGICFAVSGVPQVIDGDTLRFKQATVRIAGIDAEELNEPHGRLAKQALTMLVTQTTQVRCEPFGDETHRRKVAMCRTAEGVDLAEYMVRGGWALDCGAFSRRKYRRYEPEGVRLRLIQKPYC
jgi:endonuclease YncB( thermonuclease family)